MTGKVGRNDPCPCGSGRKYKKCCQAGFDEKDFHYRGLRRVEADLIPELLAYGLETLGPEAIEEAWREFHDHAAPGAYDQESPINSVFMPWFLFNWIHETKLPDSDFPVTTIAASFLSEHALSEGRREAHRECGSNPILVMRSGGVDTGSGHDPFRPAAPRQV